MRLTSVTVLSLFSCVAYSHAQIRISEVMFDPAASESTDEFIELVNMSPAKPFDLAHIHLGDQRSQDSIAFNGASSLLAPGQYAVIFDSDYDISRGTYAAIIPTDARILHVVDKTLGSAGLSNSTAESILLIHTNGDTLDFYTYTLGNQPGYSDECIDLSVNSNENNWGNSTAFNGTPGGENSLALKKYRVQLTLGLIASIGEIVRMAEPCELQIGVANSGSHDLQNLQLSISIDDTLFLLQESIEILKAGETILINYPWVPALAGSSRVNAQISSPDYAMQENWFLWIEWPEHSLVLNEIMFSPTAGEPEWLEVFNPSQFQIEIGGMKVRDASGRQGLMQSDKPIIMYPQSYAVFTGDLLVRTLYSLGPEANIVQLKGFPSLNNSGETIALLGKSSAIIDSIVISRPAKAGVSLERFSADSASLDSTNWLYCVADAGATPTQINSLSPVEFDLAIDTANINWQPRFPSRNMPIVIEIPIFNAGKKNTTLRKWQLTDRIDDFLYAIGEEQKELQPAERLRIKVDYTPLVSGENQFKVQAFSTGDLKPENNMCTFSIYVSFLWGDVVFNEIMATPVEGRAEWVELINTTEQEIDLQGWSFSDLTTTGILHFDNSSTLLQPHDYFIISQNRPWPERSPQAIVYPDKWPALNNDGDTIVLMDRNGSTIDSLGYSLKSDVTKGVSLENMNPFLSPPASGGWSFCVADAGSTPGARNSLYIDKLPKTGQLELSPNPFSPDGDGFEDHVLIEYDLPMQTSNVNLVVFDLRGRKVRTLLNNANSGSHRSVFWDGRDDASQLLDVGIYIVYIQALNASQGKLKRIKKTVILAKRL